MRPLANYRSVALRLAVACVLCTPHLFAQQQQKSQQIAQPGTFWSDEKIMETVNAVAMGPRLPANSWPNHARVAVILSFDDDTQAPLLRDGNTEPTALSASDYGAQTGTPRLLEILDRHQVPATFFVTGVDSLIHPELVPSLLKSGRTRSESTVESTSTHPGSTAKRRKSAFSTRLSRGSRNSRTRSPPAIALPPGPSALTPWT